MFGQSNWKLSKKNTYFNNTAHIEQVIFKYLGIHMYRDLHVVCIAEINEKKVTFWKSAGNAVWQCL